MFLLFISELWYLTLMFVYAERGNELHDYIIYILYYILAGITQVTKQLCPFLHAIRNKTFQPPLLSALKAVHLCQYRHQQYIQHTYNPHWLTLLNIKQITAH